VTIRSRVRQVAQGPLAGPVSAVVRYLSANRIREHGRANLIDLAGAYLSNCVIRVVGDGNYVKLGHGSRLSNCTVTVVGSGNKLILGQRVGMLHSELIMESQDSYLTIGDESTFQGSIHIAVTECYSGVSVGNDCMFAHEIQVRNGDSHAVLDARTRARLNPAQSVKIGNHVWVASRAMVLKGVNIGDDAIIGAGSVVTRSVATGSLAVGTPARVVRTGVTWTRSRDG